VVSSSKPNVLRIYYGGQDNTFNKQWVSETYGWGEIFERLSVDQREVHTTEHPA